MRKTLLEKVTPCELLEVFDLFGLPSFILVEFLGHQGRHDGSCFAGSSGIEQEGAGATGEDIFDGSGHLVTDLPNDFGLLIGEIRVNRFSQ